MAIYRSTELKSLPTQRVSTGIYELDYLCGFSEGTWGLPKGKITLLAGEQGVGKTRLLVEIVKNMSRNGSEVIYVQGEGGVESFKAEKLGGWSADNFWLTDDIELDVQLQHVRDHCPVLMIIDSAQQIEGWARGHGAKDIVRRYRSVIEDTDTHVIFISQMNQDGTSKGGTEFGHEVDITMFATKADLGKFHIKSRKNRFGKADITTVWEHNDEGVECISWVRLEDSKYMDTKDLKDLGEKPLGEQIREDIAEHGYEFVGKDNRSLLVKAWDWFLMRDSSI